MTPKWSEGYVFPGCDGPLSMSEGLEHKDRPCPGGQDDEWKNADDDSAMEPRKTVGSHQMRLTSYHGSSRNAGDHRFGGCRTADEIRRAPSDKSTLWHYNRADGR